MAAEHPFTCHALGVHFRPRRMRLTTIQRARTTCRLSAEFELKCAKRFSCGPLPIASLGFVGRRAAALRDWHRAGSKSGRLHVRRALLVSRCDAATQGGQGHPITP
eukprot:scaffold258260_cov35-Tisochrysis_lutea.AAC.4